MEKLSNVLELGEKLHACQFRGEPSERINHELTVQYRLGRLAVVSGEGGGGCEKCRRLRVLVIVL